MAKEKEITPEEREQVSKMVKSILEDKLSQGVYGANTAHRIFGDEGTSAYSTFMGEESITKAKIGDYNSRKQNYQKLGVVGEPSMPTDGDFSARKISQINEISQLATIGDLEEIVKSMAGLEIPTNLKNYDYKSLFEKGIDEKGKFDESRLTDEEKDALITHNTIGSIYQKACAYQVLGENYLASEIFGIEKIKEKYAPKKKG